ncbi:MAG: hypothetical protein AAB037_02565, partial [Chloroflexota bacterium]
AAANTAHFFGWDMKTALTSVGLVALGFFLLWKTQALSVTKEEISKFFIITAAPVFIFVTCLFSYNLIRAPYLIYIEEFSRAQQGVQDTKGQKAKAGDAAADAEIERLRSLLDDRKRKRGIRERLGGFLEEGRLLAARCADESKAAPTAEAQEWAERAEEFLRKNLGEGYVARFRSAAGLPLTATSITKAEHRNLWSGIYTRNARLAEFIAELRD